MFPMLSINESSMKNARKISLIEFGIGPHARRIYVPAIKALSVHYDISLHLVVDLKANEELIRSYFKEQGMSPQFHFISPFRSNTLPSSLERFLNEFVKNNRINGVIISTDPLTHLPYAFWALKNGLNILMDKPISSRKNAVCHMGAARSIQDDYLELLKRYNKLQKMTKTCFMVNTQRRFHPGFAYIKERLHEVSKKTSCPITAIQSTHCDGQWRFPNEIASEKYHGYNEGYGKISHSGYHFLDLVYQFYKTSFQTEKIADAIEVFTSFVQPDGLLHQMNKDDYIKLFGKKYDALTAPMKKDSQKLFGAYGEVDASAIIRLMKGSVCIGNISLNLLHNSFSQRSTLIPNKDLYKGNGRVKHEFHSIQQGPFQNIQVHSYQSKSKHDTHRSNEYVVGGNNHFDIYLFRNSKLIGGKPFEKISIKDLKHPPKGLAQNGLFIENVKYLVVKQFCQYILKEIADEDIVSNIDDHLFPVILMSLIYQSHNNHIRKMSPLVRKRIHMKSKD